MAAMWTRVNTVILLLVLLALLAVIAMLATDASGGPLDPTQPPSSTDGVRQPGTPISTLPALIDQSGSYYLTRNLTGAASTTGITIAADNVTLDLMGFTLSGTSGTGTGISVTGTRQSITIRNGHVRTWFNGIDAATAVYSEVSYVHVIGNGATLDDISIGISLGIGSKLTDCVVMSNTGTGIFTQGHVTVEGCSVVDNGANGAEISNNNRVVGNFIRANDVNGGQDDLRVNGSSNHVTDNTLGTVATADTMGFFARNTYCVLGAIQNPLYFPIGSAAEANIDNC